MAEIKPLLIIGLILAIVGIVLVIVYTESSNSAFAAIENFSAQGNLSVYGWQVIVGFIIGVVLLVLGVIIVLVSLKKK